MRQFIIFACMILVLTCAACSGSGAASGDTSLPPGDASRGAVLFTQAISGAPACSTCHTLDGSTVVGPSLKGFAAVASARVEGMSAQDYAHNSILKPPSYIVSGFPNLMYAQYAQQLIPQQTADLVAYLLTL